MYPQGRLRYAGLDAEGAFSVLRTASGTPDPIQARFLLRDDVPRYGNIEISFGNSSVIWRNCRAVRQTIPSGTNGRMKELTLEDRRWMWKFPKVYGRYNIWLKGRQSYVPSNRKTARELVTICLKALGESNVDATAIPKDVFPVVEFNGQSALAQLEDLVTQFGCVVVLNMNDSVEIRRIGEGSLPPINDSRVMSYTPSFEPPIIPEILRIETSRTTFQRDLPLRPYGYELLTKELKPINDLSYAPKVNGKPSWEQTNPQSFADVKDPLGRGATWDQKVREHAKSCIWKIYCVTRPAISSKLAFPIPRGNVTIKPRDFSIRMAKGEDDWRVLPLLTKQLSIFDAGKDDLTGPEILGEFHDNKTSMKNNVATQDFNPDKFEDYQGSAMRQTYPERIYPGRFSLDQERGIVDFVAPVYFVARSAYGVNEDKYKPASILLRTACELRDAQTWEFYRYHYDYKSRGSNVVTGLMQTIRVDDLHYEVGVNAETDKAAFEKKALFYAQKEIAKYALGDSATVPLRGLTFDISPDGSISAVRLERDSSGRSTTVIDWQTENPVERLTYDEKLKKLTDAQQVATIKELKSTESRDRSTRAAK